MPHLPLRSRCVPGRIAAGAAVWIACGLATAAFAETDAAPNPATDAPEPAATAPAPSGTSESAPLPPDTTAQTRPRLRFGPQIGLYMPISNKTRDRFGSTWILLGLGFGNVSDLHQNHRVALDISVLANSRSGENALFVPIGLSYSMALTRSADGKSLGYAGLSADAVVAHLRSKEDNLSSTTSLTGGAGAFIGTRFGESGYVEARYNAIAPTHGFDLSGVTLMTGLRF